MTNTTENRYAPDWVSPPGKTLAEILKERKITRTEFANRIGLSKKTVNQIIKGKVKITIPIAYKMGIVLGVPTARFWIERERLYRESLANQIDTSD